ncbi:MAG: hypothetical protein FJZ75_01470 [Bacteroidetes bacterium]|nr:hypothetical protein [Bacteroidota bacterium]
MGNPKYSIMTPVLLLMLLVALIPIFFVVFAGVGSAFGLINRAASQGKANIKTLTPHSALKQNDKGNHLMLNLGLMDKTLLNPVDSLAYSGEFVLAQGRGTWLVLRERNDKPSFLTASDVQGYRQIRLQLGVPEALALQAIAQP